MFHPFENLSKLQALVVSDFFRGAIRCIRIYIQYITDWGVGQISDFSFLLLGSTDDI
jgi:hypothetical protein